jgi:hypothetical protein
VRLGGGASQYERNETRQNQRQRGYENGEHGHSALSVADNRHQRGEAARKTADEAERCSSRQDRCCKHEREEDGGKPYGPSAEIRRRQFGCDPIQPRAQRRARLEAVDPALGQADGCLDRDVPLRPNRHAQGSTTERYLHAHRTAYPDAAELAEARLFG